MKLIPLHDNVLIKRKEGDKTTSGGLIIPASATEKSQEGEVLAVGYGRITNIGIQITPSVKPGDVVLFDKYAGAEVTVDGEKFFLIKEDNIIGIIER